MKKLLILIAILIGGRNILIPSKVYSQRDSVGFFGIIVPTNIDLRSNTHITGFGIEAGYAPNNGIGVKLEMVPKDSIIVSTVSTGIVGWLRITENYFMKGSVGLAFHNLETFQYNTAILGIGTVFKGKKVYFSPMAELYVGDMNGIELFSFSGTIGLILKN